MKDILFMIILTRNFRCNNQAEDIILIMLGKLETKVS